MLQALWEPWEAYGSREKALWEPWEPINSPEIGHFWPYFVKNRSFLALFGQNNEIFAKIVTFSWKIIKNNDIFPKIMKNNYFFIKNSDIFDKIIKNNEIFLFFSNNGSREQALWEPWAGSLCLINGLNLLKYAHFPSFLWKIMTFSLKIVTFL